MNGRRGLTLAAVLVVLGAGLLFLAGSRGWVTLTVQRAKPLPELRRTVSGSHAQPLLTALGIVGLAGVVAVLATRRVGRQLVGVLLTAVAVVGVVWLARDLNGMSAGRAESLLESGGPVVGVPAAAHIAVDLNLLWATVALIGAALLILAGLATAARGRGWPAMGSRYDRPRRTPESAGPEGSGTAGIPESAEATEGPDGRPSAASALADRRLWEALDRGEDPTANDDPR